MAKTATGSNRANKAEIIAAVGVTGAGKTTFVIQELKRRKARRLMVWDAKGEFAREGWAAPAYKISDVARTLIASKGSAPVRMAYQPSGGDKKRKADFGVFCELAFYGKNLVLVGEELAEVTLAGWAPEGWRKCTTQGRSEGLTVYGLTQSPAWVDKYFFGNCTRIRTGRILMPSHVKTMAEVMGIPKTDILGLADGEYIELDVRTRAVTRGNVFR